MDTEYKFAHKCAFVGLNGVGKSSIVSRMTDKEYNTSLQPTMGAAYNVKNCIINGKHIRLNIWDTAGQERFNSLIKMYYRGATVCIIVYDVTDYDSFVRAKSLMKEIIISGEQTKFILVGNKIDLINNKSNKTNKTVSHEEASIFAIEADISFIETSAHANQNIDNLLDMIINIVSKNINMEAKTYPKLNDTEKVVLNESSNRGSKCSC